MSSQKEGGDMGSGTKSGSGGISGFFVRMWHTLILYWIGFKSTLIQLLTFHKKFDLKKVPRRPGEVALITGGGSGIGLEVVKKLLILDMHVVIGCRNPQKANQEIDKIRQKISTGSVNVLTLDLAKFKSVLEFAEKVNLKYPKIHILINNAGVMLVPKRKLTEDGYESHLQINFLSHFLLTGLLLGKLVKGGRAGRTGRVVNVSSAAHTGGKVEFGDLNMNKLYSPSMAYMQSKLLLVISALDLNRKLEREGVPVRAYSLHPGVINSGLYTHTSCLVKGCGSIFSLSTEKGADTILFAAISSKFEGEGGHYFDNSKVSLGCKGEALKVSVQKRVWETSREMTGLKGTFAELLAPPEDKAAPRLRKISRKEEVFMGRIPRSSTVLEQAKEEEGPLEEPVVDTLKDNVGPETPNNDNAKLSISSATSSSLSISSSASTVVEMGNGLISVVIIPATATEMSSSESEVEDEKGRRF